MPTDVPSDSTDNGGAVQRASLTLVVSTSAEDSLIERRLGWSGRIPGALVAIVRSGSGVRMEATTDASGGVSFSGLLPGSYSISALRILNATERAMLTGELADIDAFGGGAAITVAAPTTAEDVALSAGARGSVVFSEVWKDFPKQPNNTFYGFGHFIELFNNGDSAVALASLLVAKGVPGGAVHNPPYTYCDSIAPRVNDSLGVWATYIYAFPPSAPALAPGASTLIATDAIDHTLIAAGTYDLSRAHFEFRGASDVDNPAVPDMVSIGPSDGGDIPGHGLMLYDTYPVLVLTDAVAIAALPRVRSTSGREYVRLPSAAIRDVMSFTYSGRITSFPLCPFPPVHSSLDRQENRELLAEDTRSLQRASMTTHPNGRRILLRTRTSARDFKAATPTPGTIP